MPHLKPVQGSHQGEDTPAVASITSKKISKNTPLESTTTFQFGYREFEGENGKHLLRELIKHILSSAECNLWEAIIEFQKKFPKAYVGAKALAKFMNRCDRTVSNGLKALHERGLLILQQDWIFRQNEDESYQCRLVTLKLFQPLYDLAYRFLQWRRSPGYVPPTWEYAEFILNHEGILDQVRDFACYQRLFKKKPGPKRHQSQGHELRPAVRCSNHQCSYCYQHTGALESEIHVLALKLVNAEDVLKCDKDKISALWNKYLQEYSLYSIDTIVYNSLTSNSNSKLDFLQKWLEIFLREEEDLRQKYSCEHCRRITPTQGDSCGQHSRDEQPSSTPAFGEIGPEQVSKHEASVEAEVQQTEASGQEAQMTCAVSEEPQEPPYASEKPQELMYWSISPEEVMPEPAYWPDSLIEALPEPVKLSERPRVRQAQNTPPPGPNPREWEYRPNPPMWYPRPVDAVKQAAVKVQEPARQLVAQVAVQPGGGNWQEHYRPLAQGPLTHEELARRKAGGGKTRPTGKKDVAQQYRPQRLPSIKEQQRMQPRRPLTRRLMLLGYSVSEKFRDANPYSTQSNLVNHMQRLLHFAFEAGLEDHASTVEDWFYQTIEYYRDAAYALPGVRSHTDQGQIKRMPWFITALKNAVVDACKALSRGEPLPEPANQARDEEVDKEAITPMLEPCEEDSMQPAEPAEINARTSDEQPGVLPEFSMQGANKQPNVIQPDEPGEAINPLAKDEEHAQDPTPTIACPSPQGNSYSHEASVGSMLVWTPSEAIPPVVELQPGGAGVHASMDPTRWANMPCDEGQQASVALEPQQPEVDPFPYLARQKVRRLLERLGVQEQLELKNTCPACNCRFAYIEPRGDGGNDYYCCRCEPSLTWSDELYERVLEVLSLPVEEVKNWSWR
ncbi:hypothetical protein KSD_63390 [Ktedonobacter sp. SOSP1-85]|uniref:hypothetical protein n=1 Tax=Ktedonobacter sp. SOSP1-85 TaxID=2778367 RepID=UPI0019153AAB|nr:hypothetical protein [Ktedonobacter sp. SOSP1-85]GHO78568.1 hypothetical protein KSD_63390 [Ktedonobacter sp. SOSP1-85]